MKHSYRALDGLRLFAALAVVFYHYMPTTALFTTLPSFVRAFVERGPTALGFFYMLSGFVLTKAYETRDISDRSGRESFWYARWARLYPVYLLAFVLFLPIAVVKYLHHSGQHAPDVRTFALSAILNLTVLQSWTPLSNSWNGPSWSLSVEALFYFVFPYLMRPLLKMNSKSLTIVVLIGWLCMILLTSFRANGLIGESVWHDWIEYNPVFWLPLFAAGIAISRITRAWATMSASIAAVVATVSLATLIILCGSTSTNIQTLYIVYGGSAPLLGLIILCFSHQDAISTKIMSWAPFTRGGSLSYIIYILQAPVWHFFEALINKLRHVSISHSTTLWEFLAYLIILVIFSAIIQSSFERPIQGWLVEWRIKRLQAA